MIKHVPLGRKSPTRRSRNFNFALQRTFRRQAVRRQSHLSTPKAPTTQVTMKFLKVGRVAIITHGRYAGKKVRTQSNICEQHTQSLLSRGMEISRRRTKIRGTGWGMCIAKTKRKRRTAIDQSSFDDPDDDAEISNTARLGEIAVQRGYETRQY